jgi:DNA-binding transcriptional LysR family regulator
MDITSAIRTFVRVVDRGSMTAAATDLGISQPAVSKLLRNLEAHMGARLLERSSRAMRPTAQGLILYEASGAALSAIDAAIEAVRSDVGAVRGNLRLHGPACIGERHLHRIVAGFRTNIRRSALISYWRTGRSISSMRISISLFAWGGQRIRI